MQRIGLNQVQTSEQFFMVPKALFVAEPYQQMKIESKMAYSILKERFKLSIKHKLLRSQ